MKSFCRIKIKALVMFVGALLVLQANGALASGSVDVPVAPVPGKVTMVDLGARKCIPCRMMAPIIEELEKEYRDMAAIVFIDVWENPQEGPKYGIQLIPTQIFYDARGKEVLRHEGFMEKAAIVAELEKLGVR